jgi:hypothetical protein
MISAKLFRSPGSIALLLASSAALAVLSHHPHIHPQSTDQMLRMAADVDLGAKALHVHGALVAILGLLLYGTVELAYAPGMRRTTVTFGLVAYVLGAAAMTTAMLLDGFITSHTAALLLEKMHGNQITQSTLDAAPAVFALLSVAIQVLTKAGFCSMGIGMCCLSLSGVDRSRLFGCMGLFAGLLPAMFVAFSGVWLRQHQLMALVASQAIWYFSAAFFISSDT